MILRDIAFVLLKSILCIINIVNCIVRGYIIICTVREAITGNKTAGNCVRAVVYDILAKRDGGEETRGQKKKKKVEITEQYDDIFSQLISAKFFQSNH